MISILREIRQTLNIAIIRPATCYNHADFIT